MKKFSYENRKAMREQLKKICENILDKRKEIEKHQGKADEIEEKLLSQKYSGMIGKPFAMNKIWNKLFLLKGFSGEYLRGISIQYALDNFDIMEVSFNTNWLRINDIGREDQTEIWNKLAKKISDELNKN